MPKMVRKQVYIEPYQETRLKARARLLGVTEAELIRQGIDSVLSGAGPAARRDLDAWAMAVAIMRRRLALPPLPGKRDWKREDAYERGGKPVV